MTAFKGEEIDEEFIQVLRDEFEKEVERREKSEDMADIGIPIPYHDWEKFPQMHKHWDVQPTPKPLFIYMGESRSFFYDKIPDNHPDKIKIEKYLQLFNRDWDEITEEFVTWSYDILDSMYFKEPLVSSRLGHMADELALGHIDPEIVIGKTLAPIIPPTSE